MSHDHTHSASELPCTCEPSWRSIIAESLPLMGKTFADNRGNRFLFFGVVWGKDDYYYGFTPQGGGKIQLLSCVGSIAQHGYTLID